MPYTCVRQRIIEIVSITYFLVLSICLTFVVFCLYCFLLLPDQCICLIPVCVCYRETQEVMVDMEFQVPQDHQDRQDRYITLPYYTVTPPGTVST